MKEYKFIVIAIIIQIFIKNSFSQINFQQTITSYEDIQRVKGYIDSDNDLIIYGYNFPDTNNYRAKSFIYRLNLLGLVIDSIVINEPNGQDLKIFSVLQQGNSAYYVFSLVSSDTINIGVSLKTIRIIQLNKNFEILSIKNFPIPYEDHFFYNAFAQFENDSTFLCVTTIRHDNLSTDSFNSYIIKLNLQLDSINSKRITGHRNMPYSILPRDKNDFYKLFTIWYNITPNTIYRLGQIIKMDPQFNIIGIDSLAGDVNSNPTVRFFNSNRDKYITVGKLLARNTNNSNLNRQIGVLVLNSQDSIIKFKHYGKSDTTEYPAWFQSLDFTSPNEIFIGGMTNFCIGCGYTLSQVNQPFILIKTDSLLNTQFEYFYDFNANLYMWSVIATPDGGCIMLGTIYDWINAPNNKHDIFILKVDANGMFTNTKDAETGKISEAIIGPNPGNDFINVIVAQQIKEPVVFAMYDFTGKKVFQETKQPTSNIIINTSMLKPGMYFYKISTSKKQLGSGKWVKI